MGFQISGGILSTLGGSQETQNSHDEFRTFLKNKWELKLSKLLKDLRTMPHWASSDAWSLVPLPVFGSPTEPFVLLFQPVKHCFLGSNNDSNSNNDQDANSSYVCWLLGNLYKFAFSDPSQTLQSNILLSLILIHEKIEIRRVGLTSWREQTQLKAPLP